MPESCTEQKQKKIALISASRAINALGLRTISSCLRSRGFDTRLIFLNGQSDLSDRVYSDDVINDTIELCRGYDLIGISVMMLDYIAIKHLTGRLREELEIPIIWGGVHATFEPDKCISIADMVCLGDGEEAIVELAESLGESNRTDIANIWFRQSDKIIKNGVRHTAADLDQYPFPDYSMDDHFDIKDGRVVPLTDDMLEQSLRLGNVMGQSLPEYIALSARNCRKNCAYCCNNALRRIFGDSRPFVRKRSMTNLVEEMAAIKKKFPFIRVMTLMDETFFDRTKEEIQEFCRLYRQNVSLPFTCLSGPIELDRDKLKLLAEAGLISVLIGIQSYDQTILRDVFNRYTPKTAIDRAVKILEEFKDLVPHPQYQFIVDNPWESNQSLWRTLRFARFLPEGATIMVFPLILLPGSALYDRARTEGLIYDELKQVYLKQCNRNSVFRMDLVTRMLYYIQDLRMENAFKPSRLSSIAMTCLPTPMFFFCFAFSAAKSYVVNKLRIFWKVIPR